MGNGFHIFISVFFRTRCRCIVFEYQIIHLKHSSTVRFFFFLLAGQILPNKILMNFFSPDYHPKQNSTSNLCPCLHLRVAIDLSGVSLHARVQVCLLVQAFAQPHLSQSKCLCRMEFLAGVRVSECSRSAKYGIANFLLFLSLNNKGLFKKENRDDVFALAAGDLMWHGRL